MSSLNHLTFDIKDAFSSPNYTPASPNYSPASPGNNPSESSNNSYGLVPIASTSLLLFHDDPYMKVMHAYAAIIPQQVPIPPPIIVPPSLMLSPIFNPQEFFVPEKLLPPKKQTRLPSLSFTDLSNPSRKQAYILVPPSFSVYTPTPPQIYKLGKSSNKIHVKHHEKQIESILNYLEEISFHYIEKIKERLVNGWIIIPRDFDEVKTKLKEARTQILEKQKKMPPKKTSTYKAPAMNQAAIRQLIDDRVATALEAQAANMVNTDNSNRNPEQAPVVRKCSYKEFMSCQPFNFKDYKVKFATGTLTEEALSWWNSFAQPIGIEEAYKITWVEFKKLLIKKYCPRTEVQKMEENFYHLTVKGNDLKTYVRRFQELAALCPTMVSDA
uniref:Reverse transcriptase domain-containing protein n=1 Tax=Tanacetum cinerariifolium TaxID=118510 RepID=A0A6L2L641_TANCI|nr:reverse transcriptase domain-containing protein [Tanacetum cinerariifolium]